MEGNVICPEVWRQIFLRTDTKTLYQCKNTCKCFNDILIKDNSFWIERARQLNIENVLPPIKWRNAASINQFNGGISIDSSKFKFNYQQIVNSNKGYKKWRVYDIQRDVNIARHAELCDLSIREGGDGIKVEGNDCGCEPDEQIENCFAFSYFECRVTCFVDLVKCGIDEWILDHVRPKIRIIQKVNHRYDCASHVRFYAEFNYNKYQRKHEFVEDIERLESSKRFRKVEKSWPQWSEAIWEDISLEFDDYPSGLRCLAISTSGQDDQFWKGYFGPKIANLEVQVILPEEIILKNYQEDVEKTEEDVNYRPPEQNNTRGGGLLANIRSLASNLRYRRHYGGQQIPP